MITILHRKTGHVLLERHAATLRGADLRSADLMWADLSGFDLRWADLQGADLRGADLCGADLSEALLLKARLTGALHDRRTRWPDGGLLAWWDGAKRVRTPREKRPAELMPAGAAGGEEMREARPGLPRRRRARFWTREMSEAGEEQVAALRAQVQRAGQTTLIVRVGLPCLVALALILGVFPWAAILRDLFTGRMPGSGPPFLLMAVIGYAVNGFCLGVPLAFPLALLYRRLRRAQLRRCLMELPPEQQVIVVEPLRSAARGDTRKILDGLVRDLRLPTELAPAPAPAGRGDEASAAEQNPCADR
jgi:hypothetical protein